MNASVFIILLSLGIICMVLLAWRQHNRRMRMLTMIAKERAVVMDLMEKIVKKL